MPLSPPGRRWFAALTIGVLSIVSRADDRAERAAQDEFFAGPIVTIALALPPDALESLRSDPRTYVEGAMKVGDRTWKGVALKLKGASGSFQPVDEKPCFTLSFGKYGNGERFHGLKKLHLNNANEDPSFLRQQLCGAMVRAAGIPALRCTHANVSLDGRELGLYVLTESYTEDLLAPFFADPSGDLFESGFCMDIDQGLTKDVGDKKDFRAIEQLLEACREDDAEERWRKLGAILDVDRFATFFSLEVLLGIGDGYDFFHNNYRIYHDPLTKLLSFIPHGMDQPFNEVEVDLARSPESIVGTAFLACPEGRALYRKRAAELHSKVLTSRDWPAEVGAASAKVLAALPRRGSGFAKEMREQQQALKETVAQRIAAVGDALADVSEPLHFDAAGVARLTSGWAMKREGDARLDRLGDKHLRIVADGECQASWRRAVTLEPGRYRFEAKVKVTGVAGTGVGLRISGAEPQGEWLIGSHALRAISYDFVVAEGVDEVTLVAELRSNRGEVLLLVDGMRLTRQR